MILVVAKRMTQTIYNRKPKRPTDTDQPNNIEREDGENFYFSQ